MTVNAGGTVGMLQDVAKRAPYRTARPVNDLVQVPAVSVTLNLAQIHAALNAAPALVELLDAYDAEQALGIIPTTPVQIAAAKIVAELRGGR